LSFACQRRAASDHLMGAAFVYSAAGQPGSREE
jgi:hypothetical protein